MRWFWTFVLFAASGFSAPDDWGGLLARIRQNVAAQVSRSANYACVETIERTYYVPMVRENVCPQPDNQSKPKEFMHDRLRLDVAVSDGSEIYSWHGENRFSSSRVDSVVHTGPISSGGFIGYLSNIFLSSGIRFTYQGKAFENGVAIHRFNYVVPRAYTRYQIRDQSGLMLVPFHGSFTVNSDNLQLTSLRIVADAIPPTARICGVETDVSYGMARISGFDSLIPAAFDLRVGNRDDRLYTESHAEYLGCREFRGESSLRFDTDDSPAATTGAPAAEAEPLPAGIELRIALRSDIDDRKSYAGDPVEGVLLKAVKTGSTGVEIPANASLHGVIAQLESRSIPAKSYYVKIEFERLQFADKSYSLRGWHQPYGDEARGLYFLFGPRLPPFAVEELQQGTMIFEGRHFHLRRGFIGTWKTVNPLPAS
jgi:hypothetical protein